MSEPRKLRRGDRVLDKGYDRMTRGIGTVLRVRAGFWQTDPDTIYDVTWPRFKALGWASMVRYRSELRALPRRTARTRAKVRRMAK